MALFPSLGSIYLDDTDRMLRTQIQEFYQDNYSITQSFWNQAALDTRIEAGDQTVWNDMAVGEPFRRRQLSFNRVRPIRTMIGGYQRRNRKSMIVVPVENGDEQTADQYTKVLMWTTRYDSMLETISDAFDGALISGLNLLQVWVDFREDPISGNIRLDRCPYNTFVIDQQFKKADLSDCNGIWKRTYLSRSECISLLPEKRKEIEELPQQQGGTDGKFPWMPESLTSLQHNLLTYDEYYYRSYRKQKMLVDTKTGESLEWRQNNPDQLKLFLQQYPQIIEMEQEVPTTRLAILVQGKVMYDGANPLGTDSYPFIPVFGYFYPEISNFDDRYQGIVRGLRDPQLLYNRRKATELDIVESQVNSGIKMKEGALINPKDAFNTGQGRVLVIKKSAQMSDVERMAAPEVPQSMFQLSEILSKEINYISGVNEELMGSAMDDKAGILSMLRQGAGLTTLQVLFDNLDRSMKLLGKNLIGVIQNNFTPGKVARIIEEDPLPQFYNKAFGKYDAAIEEGLNTTTQKQMQFAQMLQLREAGVNTITDIDLLEASTLQNKQKLIESARKQIEQQQQMSQQQASLEMQNQEAIIKSLDAKAQSDIGLGIERVSRVQENQALASEREAQAERDHMSGLLDLTKAIKEIQSIDIDKINKAVQLVKLLEDQPEFNAGMRNDGNRAPVYQDISSTL